MSAAAAAGGGAPSGASDDSAVYRAVAAGARVDEVRRAIQRSRSSAAVDQAAGATGETPLRAARRLRRVDLVCVLVEHGAAAGDGDWCWAVCWCVYKNDLAGLLRLIKLGVSVNTASDYGFTPLMRACSFLSQTVDRRDLTLEIFRRSSAETRRAVYQNQSSSAADYLISAQFGRPIMPWCAQMTVELLAAGAPVRPHNAARVQPIASAHGARREAELVASQSMGHHWRAHETFVGLSLDVGELREAQQMVAERRARLDALEREMGSESDNDSSGSGSESERESEGDESEEGEAMGSGGGSGGGQ